MLGASIRNPSIEQVAAVREAKITIRWDGPDKKVRELIEDKLDALFFDLSDVKGVTFADSSAEFKAKAK